MDEHKRKEYQVSYDRVADEYVRRIADELRHKPLDRELLERFAASVRDAGPVCDMGCGPGHVAHYLYELGVQVCGIDSSPARGGASESLESGHQVPAGRHDGDATRRTMHGRESRRFTPSSTCLAMTWRGLLASSAESCDRAGSCCWHFILATTPFIWMSGGIRRSVLISFSTARMKWQATYARRDLRLTRLSSASRTRKSNTRAAGPISFRRPDAKE